MPALPRPSRKGALTLATVGVLAAGGAVVAHAASADTPPQVIYGCVQKGSNALRIVSAGTACSTTETALQWNAQGPAGPVGPVGPQGPKGDPGSSGGTGSSPSTVGNLHLETGGTEPAIDVPIYTIDSSAENPSTIGSQSGGAGAGKVKFQPVTVALPVDATTPTLFTALASGRHFSKAVVTLNKPGTTPPTVAITQTFGLVFTTAQDVKATADGLVQTVTFVYGAANYSIPGTDGGQGQSAGWSIVTNKQCDDVTTCVAGG